MPIFEYRCETCDREFEKLVRPSEVVDCPECGGLHLEKLFSTVSGRVGQSAALPVASACPPSNAPPCSPMCCRLPQ